MEKTKLPQEILQILVEIRLQYKIQEVGPLINQLQEILLNQEESHQIQVNQLKGEINRLARL
jgi:hypothetical protein